MKIYEANIGAEGVVKVVRYCDHLAEAFDFFRAPAVLAWAQYWVGR